MDLSPGTLNVPVSPLERLALRGEGVACDTSVLCSFVCYRSASAGVFEIYKVPSTGKVCRHPQSIATDAEFASTLPLTRRCERGMGRPIHAHMQIEEEYRGQTGTGYETRLSVLRDQVLRSFERSH